MILSGPAGSGKTATLRVLSREMDFDIVEYKTSEGNSGMSHHTATDLDLTQNADIF